MKRAIRFGTGALADLGELAAELGLERLLLVTTGRFAARAAELPVVGVYAGVRSHVPVESVREAAALAADADADGLVALGGGSAVDTCKAVAAELLAARELATIAVPTTYAGAEWTPYFGVLQAPGRKGGGADERARPAGAVYDPELQLGLPLAETVGTALNALAHCAEALYVRERTDESDRHALAGAELIGRFLPQVVARPDELEAVHPGHELVGDKEIRYFAIGETVHGLLSILGLGDLVPKSGELRGHDAPHYPIIVRNKNPQGVFAHKSNSHSLAYTYSR